MPSRKPSAGALTPRGRRTSLHGLLAAYTVSLFGTRLTMIALPWLVLVTSGSAAETGLVAFCEAVPLVIGKTLAGPLIDRVGSRPFAVFADLVSAVVVGLVPLCYWLDALPYGALLVLSAAIGVARGPGDVAKRTMTPEVAEQAGIPLERASGLVGTLERLAGTAGPAAAGALIAALSPLWAMTANALCFVVSAALIALTGPRARRGPQPAAEAATESEAVAGAGTEGEPERYLDRLREGIRFLRQDRLLRSIAVMLSVTNLVDAAYGSLLIPVWAKEVGGGPAAIGALGSVFGIAAVGGSALATAFAAKLRRRPTYVIAFLIAGPPRFLVMAFHLPLWVVLVVAVGDGLAIGFVNPILNAVMLERIPRTLLGRVSALTDSVGSAGVPLGPMLAGAAVTAAGLVPVLFACAGLYLASTVLPALRPHWRELDARPASGEPTVAPAQVPDDRSASARTPTAATTAAETAPGTSA
ncbi:MFS transporter [Streptomyces sp. NRRL S-350]|uniref:MFS transporter n=1 Tax=Streptomyces sp. NRRL S-350 TaxID=1463902 RepID=UPI00099C2E94|nr:MFS transporter [Streptomyces sp. NRRL S-350]